MQKFEMWQDVYCHGVNSGPKDRTNKTKDTAGATNNQESNAKQTRNHISDNEQRNLRQSTHTGRVVRLMDVSDE